VTGWGLVERSGRQLRYVASGTIKTAGSRSFPARLRAIHDGVRNLLREWQPDSVGVEQAFVSRNVQAALRLGEARGAVLVSVATEDIDVHEYAPATVKLAVAGSGAADKVQVARGVGQLLGLDNPRSGDATDALAVAVCHAHSAQLAARLVKPA